nr:cold shock domain-containing protein [Clostridium sp. Marseille-P2415]
MKVSHIQPINRQAGYGFISTNEGRVVFVHHSQVKKKTHKKDLHEGEPVNFDVKKDDKGLCALNVQKI